MAYSDNVGYQIVQILEDDGVGTFATDLFLSKEPENPDDCITVYNTGGFPDDCIANGERQRAIHNFQVRVRNADYLTAQTEMESVRTSLEKTIKTLVDSGGTTTFHIWMTTLPIDLPRDTHNRVLLTANFACMRTYN
jgi:hypothetical protein